jgi:tetratricopeptide (TPR) repeat protein
VWLTTSLAAARADELSDLLDRLDKAFEKDDWDLVISLSTKVLQLDPDNKDVYYDRGQAYRFKKDYDQAFKDYNRALKIDPNYPRGYKGLGNLFRDKGDLDRALKELDRAVKADTTFSKSYGDRGWVHWLRREYDLAVNDYSRAIELEPKRARFQIGLGWILATCPVAKVRDGKKALAAAKKACELEPSNPFAMDTLAAAYAESGDFEQAIHWEKKALDAENATPSQRDGFKSRLDLYKQGKPYRWDEKSDVDHGAAD